MKDLETGEQMLWRGRRGWNSVGLIVRKLVVFDQEKVQLHD
jgi:hypothetical protein